MKRETTMVNDIKITIQGKFYANKNEEQRIDRCLVIDISQGNQNKANMRTQNNLPSSDTRE